MTQEEANELCQGPSLDMANQFSNVINLIMSAFFFHSILPLSLPIGCIGLFANYWANKIVFLRRNRAPDQLSGLMAKFFANFVPFIALLWALDSIIVYKILYREVFGIEVLQKIAPSLACILFVIVFIIMPIRSVINYLFRNQQATASKGYTEVADTFLSDYDIENPVTKTEGILRVMEMKLNQAGTTEEEKQALKQQMAQAQTSNPAINFAIQSNQRFAMQPQMMMMRQPMMMQQPMMMRQPMMMQQPMMMPRMQMVTGGAGTAQGFAMAMPPNMGFARPGQQPAYMQPQRMMAMPQQMMMQPQQMRPMMMQP